jgi:segregation and condensation protein B
MRRGPVALSSAAQQVLAIVAYRQPVSQAGIESVRGTSSDSALGTLLQRRLIALDNNRLFVTTADFLDYLGLQDLDDLPPLATPFDDEAAGGGPAGVGWSDKDRSGEDASGGG